MKKKTKIERAQEIEHLRNNPINIFQCLSCKDHKAENFQDFKKHLSSEHKLETEDLKGKRTMLCHIDYDKSYSSTYEWILESGLKFQQYTELARDKNTMLY